MASSCSSRLAIAGACLALMASCGGGGGELAATQAPITIGASYGIPFDNLQIAELLYRDSARTPAGFVSDPPPAGQPYVATRHLKTADIGQGGVAPYELCTDDWNQALQWSEDAAQRSGGAALVGNLVDVRYFEFQRMVAGQPTIYQRSRIFRCAYLDRSSTDAGAAAGPAGTLHRQPLQPADLRELAEYLWRFTGYNNYGHAVLASNGETVAAGLRHTLVIASLAANAGGAGCDRVDVVAWRHMAATGSGVLTRAVEPLWNFTARESAGAAVACSN